jgi:hypothetical protein
MAAQHQFMAKRVRRHHVAAGAAGGKDEVAAAGHAGRQPDT